MPTAGRFAGAVCFAALALYLTTLYRPFLPEAADPKYMSEINGVIGLIMGWTVAGSRAGTGMRAAVGYGLTTVATVLFWCLFLHSGAEMLKRSLRRAYDGATEAVVAIFELMLEFGEPMLTEQYLGAIFLGGILAGVATEVVGRRYR